MYDTIGVLWTVGTTCVTAVCTTLGRIAEANYAIVSTVFRCITWTISTIQAVVYTAYDTFISALLVTGELCTDIWRIVMHAWSLMFWLASLAVHILYLIVHSIECIIVWLYEVFACVNSSAVLCISTGYDIVTVVIRTSGDVFAGILFGFFHAVVDSLTFVGVTFTSSVWTMISTAVNSVTAVYSGIQQLVDVVTQAVFKCVNAIVTLPTDVYIGCVVMLLVYYGWNSLIREMSIRGLTFPSMGIRRQTDLDPDVEEREDGNEVNLHELDTDTEDNDEFLEPDADVQVGMGVFGIETDLPDLARLRERKFTPSPGPSCSAYSTVESLSNALETERDKRACVVCQDRMKCVLVLPCKHMCMCVACAHQIVTQAMLHHRVCPLCRANIKSVMNVYT